MAGVQSSHHQSSSSSPRALSLALPGDRTQVWGFWTTCSVRNKHNTPNNPRRTQPHRQGFAGKAVKGEGPGLAAPSPAAGGQTLIPNPRNGTQTQRSPPGHRQICKAPLQHRNEFHKQEKANSSFRQCWLIGCDETLILFDNIWP